MRKRGIARETKKRLEGTQNVFIQRVHSLSEFTELIRCTSNRQTFSEKLERIQQGRVERGSRWGKGWTKTSPVTFNLGGRTRLTSLSLSFRQDLPSPTDSPPSFSHLLSYFTEETRKQPDLWTDFRPNKHGGSAPQPVFGIRGIPPTTGCEMDRHHSRPPSVQFETNARSCRIRLKEWLAVLEEPLREWIVWSIERDFFF